MARKPKVELTIALFANTRNTPTFRIDFGYCDEATVKLARVMAEAMREKGYEVKGNILTETEETL